MANQELPRGIRLRGSRFFVDVSHKGTRKTATCDTLGEAMVKKAELLEALENGKEVKNRRANAVSWTLQQALDKLLKLPPAKGKGGGWRGCSYEAQATLNANDAIKFFGPDRKLDSLSREEIDTWLHDCETRGNSNSTINRKRSALSKMVTIADEYGGMSQPVKLPPQRKERVGRIRQISKAEEGALLQFFKTTARSEMLDAVTVLIDTGMRRGELLNLRPTDVNFKTGVCLIYGVEDKGTKNGKVRSVPMTKRVRDILEERQLGATCFDIKASEMRHAWDAARAHLGLIEDKDFTLHVCRHTCASRLVQAGVSLAVVQRWLGHENIQTTMRYAHLYPQDLMQAVKALES